MMRYPINVCKECYEDEYADFQNYVDDLGKSRNWDQLLIEVTEHGLANGTRLSLRAEPVQNLFTPLHHAVNGDAPKDVLEKLLELGACKCLRTSDGETAFDIAKGKGLDKDILILLELPQNIQANEQTIKKMEASLHEVILGYAGSDLIAHNGQVLPQLAVLYEKGDFYFPIPGMYGGFSVSEKEDGIEVYSEIRIVGGSEMTYFIDKDGNVEHK